MSTSERSPMSPDAGTGLAIDRISRISTELPEKTAVRFADAAISYRELNARADALAAHLARTGVGAGDLVGIGMDRSLDLVAAVLGAWKAGAAFVPLEPEYPEFRRAQMLEDAAPRAIIADRRNRARMAVAAAEVVVLDDIPIGETPPDRTIKADSPAYVMFTSGSTGRPKGVEVSHAALANFLTAIQQVLGMQSADVMAAVTTLSFDISILEIVLPLAHGATVVVLDRNVSGDGRKLASALEKYECTFMQATPTTWRLLVDGGWSGKDDLTIVCGGESFPRDLAEELLARGRRVFNAYGPTEATIWATVARVRSARGPVPIGRALSNYDAHVLDEDMEAVARGEAGQLYIGGESLATGYLNRPEETALRFITHADAGRLYASGDLVRESDDGTLEFVGRVDEQVKIRGFRVELGEIETRLHEIPGVKSAVVVARDAPSGGKKIVAYLVPDLRAELATGELRGALETRLPGYMIPHHFVQLDELPTTPNNKVDRSRLPDPEGERAIATPSNDPLEAHLQSVWTEVLDAGDIRIDDNFFDLGGDSVQAARVTNRLEEWLGELLWPVVLFDAPTISELAGYLRETYPDAVAAKTRTNGVVAEGTTDQEVDDGLVAEFEAKIQTVPPGPPPAAKNPPAVFVLCPPRSGSTLLRVILAGHPGLFAPPEVELLTFNDMSERAEVFSGRESYRLEGAIRAVMEARRCDADAAREILAGYEDARTTIPEFYGALQSWLDGRVLVDKTPANTLDLHALGRIEDYFEQPLYIHLTRHPLAMIRSFLEARLSAVFFRRTPHDFSPRELAELVWLTSHRNTLQALASVPSERRIRVTFETLTRAPEATVGELCDFLGIEVHPEMLEPWKNKGQKMTDGLQAESKMMGDPKFHQYDRIDPSVADRWMDEMPDATLGRPARAVAVELGYLDVDAGRDGPEREEFVL